MISVVAGWSLRFIACGVGALMLWQIFLGNSAMSSRTITTQQSTASLQSIGTPSVSPSASRTALLPLATDSAAAASEAPPDAKELTPTQLAELTDPAANLTTASNVTPAPSKPPQPGPAMNDRTFLPPAANSANTRIEITHAERIRIRFQGYNDLSGEYRIDADNTISIPVLGRLNVAGMVSSELERHLARRVLNITGREAHVTVEVAAYNPVLINGFITRPGSTPWSPGMTVLHAETLAGGIFRPGERSGGINPTDGQITRIRRTGAELERVLATLSRLQAERKGVNEIVLTKQLLELAGKQHADALIKAQTSALVSRNNAISTQLQTVEQALTLSEKEVQAMDEQSNRIDYQLKVREDLLNKLTTLRQKGHIHNDRFLNEQAKVAELQERRANVAVSIARVRSEQIRLKREAVKLKLDRRAELDTEILKLEREATQLQIELDAARIAYRKLSGREAASIREESKKIVISYEIIRKNNSGLQRVAANQTSILLPGDVLIINNEADQ